MKRYIFIPILALAILSACSTTKVGGRTYNILPLDIEREDFSIVAEDNYQETMKTIVGLLHENLQIKGVHSPIFIE